MKNECTPCCPPRMILRGDDVDRLAAQFKALGDPTRLAIVALLRDADAPLCACEIETSFDLSQPTISHHLRQLRGAGLLHAERRGTWMYFHLAPEGIDALDAFVRGLAPARTTYSRTKATR